jgi:hypothetical protein
MRSVAIIGFSEKTMKYCLSSKADEIWSLNHIYTIRNFPQVDRLFELHHKYWYLRKEIPKSVAYNKWLRQKHPFPIYMQKIHKEVPSSVVYPLKEVIADCLPGLLERGELPINDLGKLKMREYFTSSFAYMIGLAIHEKFDVIEIYGVDMENDTEYGYQRPCGEFWIGLALGRGIKIVLPEPCLLCNAPLYGYDVVPYIDVNRLKEILKIYQNRYNDYYLKMQKAGVELTKNPEDQELSKEYMHMSAWVYLHSGAITAISKLIENSDSYISRQYIDLKRRDWANGLNFWTAKTNNTKAEYIIAEEAGNKDEKLWMNYQNARASMYANLGGVQLHQQLMWTIDMRPIEYDLHMEIIELDSDIKSTVPVSI